MAKNEMTKLDVLAALKEKLLNNVAEKREGSVLINKSISQALYDAMCAYVDNEMYLLKSKRAKAKSTQTKAQKENEALRAVILEVLDKAGKPLTINQIAEGDPKLAGLSCQKISALISPLVINEKNADGVVTRTTDKKIAYFSYSAPEEEEEPTPEENDATAEEKEG